MTKRLGRGLADIIGSPAQSNSNFIMLRAEQIRTSRFQPRTSMTDKGLEELQASIKRTGVIEPIVVRPIAHGTYELVAGERRLKASQHLGIQEVPAIVKTLSDQEALEFSLVENVQRENLNPLEEAGGYTRLSEEFGYTQEDIGAAVGKDRATIANIMRLLGLPEDVRHGLGNGAITMGHAKVLLSLEDRQRQTELYKRITAEGLSVRQTEALASAWVPAKKRRVRRVDPQIKPIEDELRRALGTKVSVVARKKGGRILIEYFSQEDLTRILPLLGVSA